MVLRGAGEVWLRDGYWGARELLEQHDQHLGKSDQFPALLLVGAHKVLLAGDGRVLFPEGLGSLMWRHQEGARVEELADFVERLVKDGR